MSKPSQQMRRRVEWHHLCLFLQHCAICHLSPSLPKNVSLRVIPVSLRCCYVLPCLAEAGGAITGRQARSVRRRSHHMGGPLSLRYVALPIHHRVLLTVKAFSVWAQPYGRVCGLSPGLDRRLPASRAHEDFIWRHKVAIAPCLNWSRLLVRPYPLHLNVIRNAECMTTASSADPTTNIQTSGRSTFMRSAR